MPQKIKNEQTKGKNDWSAAFAPYLARRDASRAAVPSVINPSTGAYLAVALVAVAALAASAWRPSGMAVVIAAASTALLLAGFAVKAVFGGLLRAITRHGPRNGFYGQGFRKSLLCNNKSTPILCTCCASASDSAMTANRTKVVWPARTVPSRHLSA
jgi:hypothetical protein